MSDPARKPDDPESDSNTPQTEPEIVQSVELATETVQVNEGVDSNIVNSESISSDNENTENSNPATDSDEGNSENSSANTVIDNNDVENASANSDTVTVEVSSAVTEAITDAVETSTGTETVQTSTITATESEIGSSTTIPEVTSDLQANTDSEDQTIQPDPVVTDSLNPIPEFDPDIQSILDSGRLILSLPRPVISNASSSSSRGPSVSESPSRRFFNRWKVAPSPDEVITIDPMFEVSKPVRGQELVVYTAPLYQRIVTSDNNNPNANLPVPMPISGSCPVPCSDSAEPEPSPEAQDAAPAPCILRISNSDNYDMVCRICHDTPSKTSCITPCLCKGSMGVVHRECLERWLSESLKTSCEICGYKYNTTRRPRYHGCTSVCAWLKSPVNQADTRNVFFDIACFFILTPLAIISAWLCVIGARHYTSMGQKDNLHGRPYETQHRGKPHRYRGEDTSNSTWTSVGLLALTGTLLAAYYIWLFVAIRYHYQVWKDWKQRNYVVTVLPISPEDLAEAQHHHDHHPTAPPGTQAQQPPFRNRRATAEVIDVGFFDLDAEASASDISRNLSPYSDLSSPGVGTSRTHAVHVNENDTSTSSTETSSGSSGTTSSYSSSGEVTPRLVRDQPRSRRKQ